MKNYPIDRLDKNLEIREQLLPFCRIKEGEIWEDPIHGHRIACLEASSQADIDLLMNGKQATLSIQYPPYNLIAFEERLLAEFIAWFWETQPERIL